MKKHFMAIIFLILVGTAYGENTTVTERTAAPQKCTTPIAKVAMGNVRCKAAQCQKADIGNTAQGIVMQLLALSGQPSIEGIGEGISEMYISALKQSGCFEILDRENLRELQQELQMMGKSLAQAQVADYIISGAITAINVEVKNTSIGGGYIPVIGGIDIKKTNATMTMDMRLIDVASTTILTTKTYSAQSGKTNTSLAGGGFWDFGAIASHSSLKGTPLEDVTRDVVVRSIMDLITYLQSRQQAKANIQPQPASTTDGLAGKNTPITQ